MLARLTRIVLMVRQGEGLAKATEFYHQGLGLSVVRATDDWTELRGSMGGDHLQDMAISLQVVNSEAQVSTGYSPLLNFEIMDMDTTITKCIQYGGVLDGPIQYPAHGKVASIRSPDGHMIGLYEPTLM